MGVLIDCMMGSMAIDLGKIRQLNLSLVIRALRWVAGMKKQFEGKPIPKERLKIPKPKPMPADDAKPEEAD